MSTTEDILKIQNNFAPLRKNKKRSNCVGRTRQNFRFSSAVTSHLLPWMGFRCNLCFVICNNMETTLNSFRCALRQSGSDGTHMKDSGKLQEIKSEKSHISDSINCYQYNNTTVVCWVWGEISVQQQQKITLIFSPKISERTLTLIVWKLKISSVSIQQEMWNNFEI